MLGPDGKPVRPTMGCYGIGVSRAVAAIAEQHHDERGLVWPAAVAPCRRTPRGCRQGRRSSTRRWSSAGGSPPPACGCWSTTGTHVSAGVKFTDAELIGIPRAVVVGRRLAEGYVELRERAGDGRIELPLDGLVDRLVHEVRQVRASLV